MPDVMCATIHNATPVIKGQTLAGTRAIPLVIEKKSLEQALEMTAAARLRAAACLQLLLLLGERLTAAARSWLPGPCGPRLPRS